MLGLEWGIFLTQRARRKRKGRRGNIHFREFERFFYHKGHKGGTKSSKEIESAFTVFLIQKNKVYRSWVIYFSKNKFIRS